MLKKFDVNGDIYKTGFKWFRRKTYIHSKHGKILTTVGRYIDLCIFFYMLRILSNELMVHWG